ncbi:MAG: alpha/beta hydrolase [Rhodospirillaceae bacterium]
MLDNFEQRRIAANGTEINLRWAGSGPPLLLIHGYPQTNVMWHKIAPRLAEDFTVVCPDVRGYGDSGKPPTDAAHRAYCKSEQAKDLVEVMAALGHERFFVGGHDRGGRVAYRLTLDHQDRVGKLAVLDIVPTVEQYERMKVGGAQASFHWYFLAQPAPLPERLIGNDPEFFFRHVTASWTKIPGAFDGAAMAEYLRCFSDPKTIRATCEDYRAGYAIDRKLDAQDRAAGRKITCPVLALWGDRGEPEKPVNVLEIWKTWADNVTGQAVPGGHFLPEESPEETLAAMRAFFMAS